jgi:hypothetical protein
MNNRELIIQQRLLMVKKDLETAYHEVIEGSSSKYIALYSLTQDRTDVFHVKKDRTTGNILKL